MCLHQKTGPQQVMSPIKQRMHYDNLLRLIIGVPHLCIFELSAFRGHWMSLLG